MSEPKAVALLSQVGELGRHLREALAQAGVPLVYEALPTELDRTALEQSGARVVVINLDHDVEAHLDDIHALLVDERYNVIFNEAQVSSQLSGWELARWARHLAAKISGDGDIDPPRPADAEAVPTPMARMPAADTDAGAEERPDEVAQETDLPVPASEPDRATVDNAAAEVAEAVEAVETVKIEATEAVEDFSFDDLDVFARLISTDDDPAREEDESTPAEQVEPLGATDAAVGSLADWMDVPPPPLPPETEQTAQSAPADLASVDLEDFAHLSFEFDGGDASATTPDSGMDLDSDWAELPPVPVDDGADHALSNAEIDFADLDAFAGELDFDDVPASVEPARELIAAALPQVTTTVEDSLPASADLDALRLDSNDAFELIDLDLTDSAQDSESASVEEPLPPVPQLGSAFGWELEGVDDDAPTEGERAEPQEFGIEKISAVEYLAVETDESTTAEFSGGLGLELVPLEEAVLPQQKSSVHEAWLDPSSSHIRIKRVWVLGASIGGPEALREFLGALPAGYPALFVLAQHTSADFTELMVQQLTKSTAIPVRLPAHGERVSHGELIVAPPTHRLRVDVEGVVTLEALGANTASHLPSIDQVLTDVADNFAERAGAIIFSGMTEDAIEGCRYLAEKGGQIHVQDPQTCVVSSMVDGVIATGVVSFSGTPRELAAHLLGETPPAANP